MKRLAALALSAVLLFTAAFGGVMAESTGDEPAVIDELWAHAEAYTLANAEEYALYVSTTLAYDESLLSNDLGYRTAGSDAEHAAADWIANEMESLGLVEIEKIPVTVDLFQFNDASLTIEGTDIDIMPAMYQANGTDENGITAELVDVGTGLVYDYEDVDVEGKIVLCGVDQWNISWISGYMAEAYSHGAAALVTYDIGGYGTYDDDQINVQDICQDDLLPTAAISYNQYLELAAALEQGSNIATLKADCVMIPEGGVSYDVCGRIKGRSSEQQIIISGHYDVYFNGFQDDSAAIGLVMGIAKTMLDSGFVPEHDIVFMAHGSEEWGATGTEFDWTTGAWELINNVRPEWAEQTIAMINFELPAFYDGMAMSQISCVPEYAAAVEYFVSESGLLPEPVNGIYPDGVDSVSVDSNTMEDGISYRFAGVPYFVNVPGTQSGEEGWIQQHYHTPSDDLSTYSADVMATNINTYGVLAMFIDSLPAMPVDFFATCEDLAEAYDEDIFALAGADTEGYAAALSNLFDAAQTYSDRIAELNGAEEYDFAAGDALNLTTHKAFKAVQDGLIGVIASSDVVIRHNGYLDNIYLLLGVIDALENGELGNEDETGALDLAWMLNGGREYTAYIFGVETVENAVRSITQEYNEGNMFWGTDKGYENTGTYLATMSLLYSEDEDFSDELAVYAEALERQLELLAETVANEIEAMNTVAAILNG